MIHPTAIVSDKAIIGKNVKIGPYSIIEEDVVIGDGSEIRSSVCIQRWSSIGKNCIIHHGVVVGAEPQDLKYDGQETHTIVGDNTTLREYVTIHRGTEATKKTTVGSGCLLMAYVHVAHDCRVGNNVIISNMTQMAGHVRIDDWCVIGGVAKIHQFCVIGKHSMIGADVKIVKDVAPYTLIGRNPAQVDGINKVGLRRRGFSNEIIKEIENFYDTILFSGMNNRDGIKKYKERGEYPAEVEDAINFIENSTRGIYR